MKITEHWFEHRGQWLGISDEKLLQTKLPDPPRWIYKFAGEWSSNCWKWNRMRENNSPRGSTQPPLPSNDALDESLGDFLLRHCDELIEDELADDE